MVPITTTEAEDGSGPFTSPAPVASPNNTPASGVGGPLNNGLASDDSNKKIRKPYTITKSRESWTEQEHDKFLESLQLFDRDWKKIEAFVGSKTVIQIRSHAQKYFLKVQKNGSTEHVPPPRPKRKSAHPYPQKASKNATQSTQTSIPHQASPCLVEHGYAIREAAAADSSSVHRKSTTGATAPSWSQNSVPPLNTPISSVKDEMGHVGSATVNNCCSSTESPSGTWPISETTDQINHVPTNRIMPDFAQVHRFIGSVFDPNISDHLQTLKEMDPIDVETVFLLMRNLSFNLTSPDFEDHRRLLSSYDNGSDEAKSNGAKDLFHSSEVTNAPIR